MDSHQQRNELCKNVCHKLTGKRLAPGKQSMLLYVAEHFAKEWNVSYTFTKDSARKFIQAYHHDIEAWVRGKSQVPPDVQEWAVSSSSPKLKAPKPVMSEITAQYILEQCIPVIWTALTGVPGTCLMWQGDIAKVNKQEVPVFANRQPIKHWLWYQLHGEHIDNSKLWSACGHTQCVQPSHVTKTYTKARN